MSLRPERPETLLPQETQKAFTLIELLVVITLIGILVALMFPALSRAREKGNMATCTSNLHNIGQAITMYSDDNGGFLPPLSDGNNVTWDTKILPYLSNSKTVFLCPTDPWPRADPLKGARTYAANGGVSYPPHTAKDLPFGDFGHDPIHKLVDIASCPNRLILISERPGSSPSNRGYLGSFAYCSLDTIPGTVHLNQSGSLYMFVDMGVEYLAASDVLYGKNNYWYMQ